MANRKKADNAPVAIKTGITFNSQPQPQLIRMVGEWKGTMRFWFVPRDGVQEVAVKGKTYMHPQNYLVHESSCRYRGQLYAGWAGYHYDDEKKVVREGMFTELELAACLMSYSHDPGLIKLLNPIRNRRQWWTHNELTLLPKNRLAVLLYLHCPSHKANEVFLMAETIYERIKPTKSSSRTITGSP